MENHQYDAMTEKSSNSAGNIVILGVMIVSILGLYYIFVDDSKSEQKKVTLEQSYINQRIQNSRDNLELCLDQVDQRVRNDVLSWCKTFAENKSLAPNVKFIDLGPNCSIPQESLEDLTRGWEKDKKEGKEDCYKRYPQ